MLKLIAGGFHHTILLLTLQHPGSGLPEKRNSLFWWLIAVGLTINSLLRIYLGSEADLALAMATIAFGLVGFFLKPSIAAAYCLASVAIDLLHVGILMVIGAELSDFVRLVVLDMLLTIWLVVGVLKMAIKQKKAQKKV